MYEYNPSYIKGPLDLENQKVKSIWPVFKSRPKSKLEINNVVLIAEERPLSSCAEDLEVMLGF